MQTVHPAVAAFQAAAESVPAYRTLLAEAGVDPARVRTLGDFQRLVPVIDKEATFGRFGLAEVCRGGRLGRLSMVLTSSGHSGLFAYGVCDAAGAESAATAIDDALDAFFGIRRRPTLLVNCLPMGVKVYTRACTLAETSVRADMVTAVVSAFGPHHEQIILVGETAFLKAVAELGRRQGLDWSRFTLQVVVGEEPMAENARTYLAGLLGIDPAGESRGMIVSSMGIAEFGLNLFYETSDLIALRRALAGDAGLRQAVLGPGALNVPMIFTYDPRRILAEVLDDGRLVLTTLHAGRVIPLVRYLTGDVAAWWPGEEALRRAAEAARIPSEEDLIGQPILLVHGRGRHAMAGRVPISPEQVKEGLYADAALAGLTTANFRLTSGTPAALLRVQLVPGAAAEAGLAERFAAAVARYSPARLTVRCEPYETFTSGMSLDYERKFAYLEDDHPSASGTA